MNSKHSLNPVWHAYEAEEKFSSGAGLPLSQQALIQLESNPALSRKSILSKLNPNFNKLPDYTNKYKLSLESNSQFVPGCDEQLLLVQMSLLYSIFYVLLKINSVFQVSFYIKKIN